MAADGGIPDISGFIGDGPRGPGPLPSRDCGVGDDM